MLVGKNSHTFHLKVHFLALLEPSIPPEGELYNLSLVKGLAWKAWREVHVYSLKMVEGWMNLNNIIQISPELHDWSNWHLPDAFFMIIFITDFTSQTFATPVMTETQYMNIVCIEQVEQIQIHGLRTMLRPKLLGAAYRPCSGPRGEKCAVLHSW